jgi:hypothetical protein
MNISKYMTALAFGLAISTAGAEFDPRKFTFSMPYIPGGRGTVWELDGRDATLKVKGGRHVCTYLKDLDVPAFKEANPYTGETEWGCPDVAVRHLYDTDIIREGGKCYGMVCKYDLMQPGNQVALVTDHVENCPDIIVTTAGFGKMNVVGWKYYSRGDNPATYFERGYPLNVSLIKPDGKLRLCATEEYLAQLKFYLGPDYAGVKGMKMEPVTYRNTWDGK